MWDCQQGHLCKGSKKGIKNWQIRENLSMGIYSYPRPVKYHFYESLIFQSTGPLQVITARTESFAVPISCR